MLGMIEEFRPAFAERDIEIATPNVVQIMPEDELVTLVPQFDGWIIGDDPASARVLEAGAAGRLRAAVKWGVGVDNVDFAAAKRLGLKTANTPGVFGREVADVALAYVLGLARETYRIDRVIRQENGWPKPQGISTWGKTAAVVGFGDIGRQTAKRLLACDMRVVAYDPVFKPVDGLPVEPRDWPEGLDKADFLIFTCPLTPQTRLMFNADVLPLLKQGVRVVNVSRGPVIEETALLKGLESGIVHSAALDVFEVEPLAPASPLRRYDRCIFGSHNGSNTVDAVRAVSLKAIDILSGFLGVPT
jgi:D-3-phosphoglycerate dehydrogenase